MELDLECYGPIGGAFTLTKNGPEFIMLECLGIRWLLF